MPFFAQKSPSIGCFPIRIRNARPLAGWSPLSCDEAKGIWTSGERILSVTGSILCDDATMDLGRGELGDLRTLDLHHPKSVAIIASVGQGVYRVKKSRIRWNRMQSSCILSG